MIDSPEYYVASFTGGSSPPYAYVFTVQDLTIADIRKLNRRPGWGLEKPGWYFIMVDMLVYYRGPYEDLAAVLADVSNLLEPEDGAQLAGVHGPMGWDTAHQSYRVMNQ